MCPATPYAASADQPLVSVIIPTRDCLPWLPKAIESALIQAKHGLALEILVVDDGSSDGTDAYLRRLAVREPSLRGLAGPQRGVAAARNRAIAAARGRFLAFLDADDVWHPGKLARQVGALLANPAAVFAFTDYAHVGEGGTDLGGCFAYWPGFARLCAAQAVRTPFVLPDAVRRLYRENVVGTSTVVAVAEAVRAIGGFDDRYRVAEDWDAWLKLAAFGAVLVDPRVGTTYLVRTASTSRRDPTRLAALAAVAAGHATDSGVTAGDRRAVAARLAEAEAEQLAMAAPWSSFRRRCRALACAPGRRRFRECAAALRTALCVA